jgi:ABC-type multidrug transport system fused ATPase/permease subunit
LATDDERIDVILMIKVINELKIYLFLFILLALAMHFKAWLNSPIDQIKLLPSSSLGVWHPFIITLGVYIVLSLFRLIINFIKKIIKKGEN